MLKTQEPNFDTAGWHKQVSKILAAVGGIAVWVYLKDQRDASELQLFEARYFELLKIHRDNISEIQIQRESGRKVFVLLFRELRCALEIVKSLAATSGQELTQQELVHVAYCCLFYGVGPNSSRTLRMSLSIFNQTFVSAVEAELNKQETKDRIRESRKFDYVPFEGHLSRLGHYYRHLYQMVRYVDKQKFTTKIKYEYVKTIRAQLSTHEQALLLANSLTVMGRNWWRHGLMVKYRLVQNIPRDFFESSNELDTSILFEPGYFEWEEFGIEQAR